MTMAAMVTQNDTHEDDVGTVVSQFLVTIAHCNHSCSYSIEEVEYHMNSDAVITHETTVPTL